LERLERAADTRAERERSSTLANMTAPKTQLSQRGRDEQSRDAASIRTQPVPVQPDDKAKLNQTEI
jgi:hypothetical protein